jgi:phosphoglycerol transferase MdoB-like AlkP superfamily enzyme
MSWIHSRRLHFLIIGTLFLFALFAGLRAVFFLFFSGFGWSDIASNSGIVQSLGIGLRFDLRLAILVMLPAAILSAIPRFNLSTISFLRALFHVWLWVALAAMLMIYVFDFGHYSYLGQRINATIFRFLGDPAINARMLWESYPVVWILLGWAFACFMVTRIMARLRDRIWQRGAQPTGIVGGVLAACVVMVATFFGLLGRVTNINIENPVPLRWSDAFIHADNSVTALGLNPVLFLNDTSWLPHEPFDADVVKEHYPEIANYLGVTPTPDQPLSFVRRFGPQPHRLSLERPPNVVMIMLESLGASSVSMFGNPLDTTPHLQKIADEGWFFERFYVPVTGTAKTVWASFTGIPDVSRQESATRNPLVTRQKSLVNEFEGYTKLYAIGGNAGWANMSSLIRNSVDGVTLYEEGFWTSPNVDVWGLSDDDLFRETNELLKNQPKDKPFFIYIQTASNHRPYTIPEDHGDFEILDTPMDQVKAASFTSREHYNAVRFLDHNIGKFMEMAKEAGYFENTIFVMFGDHNTWITHIPFMPPAFEQLGLESNHVPAIIYAPKLLQPRVFSEATGLCDMLPTLLGMLGIEYETGVMGRDVQLPAAEGERVIPLVVEEATFPIIGAVTRNHLLKMRFDGQSPSLHDLNSQTPTANIGEQNPAEFNRLSKLARGLYEASHMMMYTNVRAPDPAVAP